MSTLTGITADEIRDKAISDLQISDSAAIKELKLLFDTVAGHNHNSVNSRAVFGGGTSALVIDAAFTGSIDGINSTFTMVDSFMTDTTSAYVDGIRQKRGVFFTESPPNQIVFSAAPHTGATLIFDYISA